MSTNENGNEERPKKIRKVEGGFNGVADVDNAVDFKRTKTSVPLLPRDAKVLLLDIEGCTTSISFVKDVLFPYALDNVEEFLNTESDVSKLKEIASSLQQDVDKLDEQHAARKEIVELNTQDPILPQDNKSDDTESMKKSIIRNVKGMMKHDVKATGLKSLQGKIWKNGYASGQLKGHIYADFLPTLQWCKSQNIKVNIYSSGSIGAQKLLFGCSTEGDLCTYFHQHFDTTSGSKKESESYKNIAKSLGVSEEEICFISDAEAELVAARDAGIGFPVMSVRPGNVPLTDIGRGFPIIYSLLQVCGSGL